MPSWSCQFDIRAVINVSEECKLSLCDADCVTDMTAFTVSDRVVSLNYPNKMILLTHARVMPECRQWLSFSLNLMNVSAVEHSKWWYIFVFLQMGSELLFQ